MPKRKTRRNQQSEELFADSPSSSMNTSGATTLSTPADLRLSPFYKEDPALWFLQAEAQLGAKNITSETTKFGLVVSLLPGQVASEVRDLLTTPGRTPYTDLKEAILYRIGPSVHQNVRALLSQEDLGDRTPSQLLRRMKSLLGGPATSNELCLLRELFLNRLPPNIRMVLSGSVDIDLDALAERADRMLESAVTLAQPAVNAVHTSANEIKHLTAMVEDLQKQVSHLQMGARQSRSWSSRPPSPRQRGPRSSRQQSPRTPRQQVAYSRAGTSRGGSPRRLDEDEGYCFYHARFGRRAYRCSSPCSFNRSQRRDNHANNPAQQEN